MTLLDLIRGRKAHVCTVSAEHDSDVLTVAKKAQIAVAIPSREPSDDCGSKLLSLIKKRSKIETVAAVDAPSSMEVTQARIAALAMANLPKSLAVKSDEVVELLLWSPGDETLYNESIKSCLQCAHYARPGCSDGYCGGGREDLKAAYGLNHPLRRVPDDFGATCVCFARLDVG